MNIPDEVLRCLRAQVHLTDCDDDGFCNFCGHQTWQTGPTAGFWPEVPDETPHLPPFWD